MSDKYSSLYKLGAGAFGTAWVVQEKITDRKYVSKVIQMKGLSRKDVDQCITEVAVLSACRHDNIVRYIQAFVSGGALNIIMELAAGGDLAQKIKKQNGAYFQKEIVIDWFLQVMMALNYIHGKNILHRDLKPQNLFLTTAGVVKLGDFGIARVLCGADDLASTRIGTPFYISPEICRGETYNSSSDMWAAGCLLYEMCCLRVPFPASNMDQLMARIVLADYPPIPSHFGEVISQTLQRLLSINPADRLTAKDILKKPDFAVQVSALRRRNLDRKLPKRSRSFTRGHLKYAEGQRSSSANRILNVKHIKKCHQSVSEDRSKKVQGLGTNYGDLATSQNDLKQVGGLKNSSKKTPESRLIYKDRSHSTENKVVKTPERELNDTVKPDSAEKTSSKMPGSSGHSVAISGSMFKKWVNEPAKFVNSIKGHEFDAVTQRSKTGLAPYELKEVSKAQIKVENGGNKAGSSELDAGNVEMKDSPVCNSYPYTIKESVARKLSEASPKIAKIIRRQLRSSSFADLTISPPLKSLTRKGDKSSMTDDEAYCEVFFPVTEANRQSIDSSTYTLSKVSTDVNNNSSCVCDSEKKT